MIADTELKETHKKEACRFCGSEESSVLLSAPDRFHAEKTPYTLLRCESCSLVWLHEPPPPDQIGKHYGPDYDRMIAAGGVDTSHWLLKKDVVLRHRSGGSLLDLGCSAGGFLESMKGSWWKLHGIEMSAEVAKKAEEKTGAKIFVGDILDAPFAPESFDAITCFHVFEHLYEPLEVMRKVASWLKPGGIFYVIVPNIDSAGARIFGSYWYALELPRHLYHFSPNSLRNGANLSGLVPLSINTDREVFIEYSSRYVLDEVSGRLGVERVSLAKAKSPGVPFRAVRKAFRMTVLPVLNRLASFAGDGESIHAVFGKN